MYKNVYIHHTSEVSPEARIGVGTKIWQHCQVRENAEIGENCILSKGVYIDAGVVIGNNVKIQNGISVYKGVTLEDGVFCGPHCVFTNDKRPRAINPDGSLKGGEDWVVSETLVKKGASIGAHATIICGNTLGKWSMVGAGAVVTKDVPDYGLVIGNPARLVGFVCPCGEKLNLSEETKQQLEADQKLDEVVMSCPACSTDIAIPYSDYKKIV
jgi:UDP-2-acetamido-3-amino-2,3-dideoxy-glucuronate N-acetyltransferase